MRTFQKLKVFIFIFFFTFPATFELNAYDPSPTDLISLEGTFVSSVAQTVATGDYVFSKIALSNLGDVPQEVDFLSGSVVFHRVMVPAYGYLELNDFVSRARQFKIITIGIQEIDFRINAYPINSSYTLRTSDPIVPVSSSGSSSLTPSPVYLVDTGTGSAYLATNQAASFNDLARMVADLRDYIMFILLIVLICITWFFYARFTSGRSRLP